ALRSPDFPRRGHATPRPPDRLTVTHECTPRGAPSGVDAAAPGTMVPGAAVGAQVPEHTAASGRSASQPTAGGDAGASARLEEGGDAGRGAVPLLEVDHEAHAADEGEQRAGDDAPRPDEAEGAEGEEDECGGEQTGGDAHEGLLRGSAVRVCADLPPACAPR